MQTIGIDSSFCGDNVEADEKVKFMTLPPTSTPRQDALILIAEDESEIAEILAAYLQRGGLRTVHARDGQEALTHHQTLKPDLVLLDVQMGGIERSNPTEFIFSGTI